MGSGKTYWGRLWAAKNGMQFFDLDELIEQDEKRTVAEIFIQNGEPYFRQKETDILKATVQKENCIVACGGGTPCFNNNMQWMNENGITVYFLANPSDIFNRVILEQKKRPLIKNLSSEELLIFIENTLIEREQFYLKAKMILPVTQITLNTIDSIVKNSTNKYE